MAGYVQMMRGQVLTIKEADYIMAGKLQGNKDFRLMFRHILPNSISPIIVMMTQQVGSTILSEAGLSFLGLGISAPTASWVCPDAWYLCGSSGNQPEYVRRRRSGCS